MSTPASTPNPAPIASLEITTPRRDLLSDAWYRLIRNKASVVGMVIIVFFSLVAIFAPVLAPHNPLQLNSGKDYLPPFWQKGSDPSFPMGTDTLGRDVLSRVIYGARVSMMVGFIPTVIILIIGTVIGLYSGFTGGMVDNILMRLTDVIYAFPDLLFFIIVMISLRDTVVGKLLGGLFLLFLALSFVNWVGVARIVRGQVLSLKEKEFIEAARAVGANDRRIIFVHLLPNVIGPLIVAETLAIPGYIFTEAFLSFIGLGVQPGTPSWGAMISQVREEGGFFSNRHILLVPSVALVITTLAFNFLGDGLRDALDPRLRGT